MKSALILLLLLLLLAVITEAFANPPAGVDPTSSAAQWFHSLKDEDGRSCCGMGDCRAVRAKQSGGHWWVWIKPDDASSVRVPDAIVQGRDDNPTGHSILCASPVEPETIMYCFIPMGAV